MAAPLIRNVLVESSKKISNPDQEEIILGRPTVYDTWFERYPDPNHPEQPRWKHNFKNEINLKTRHLSFSFLLVKRVGILGSGSDFTPFMHNLGVPSMHFLYMYREVRLG